jgi:hypothetical protein
MVVNPLGEKGRRWSVYTYAFNNPMRFVEPDGVWASQRPKNDAERFMEDCELKRDEEGENLLKEQARIHNGSKGVNNSSTIGNLKYSGNKSHQFESDVKELSKNYFGSLLLAAISIGGKSVNVTSGKAALEMLMGEVEEPGGHTYLSEGNQVANVYYQPSFVGPADGVSFNSVITLSHELFHAVDLLSAKNKIDNPIVSFGLGHESLNGHYTSISSSLFNGNTIRLFMESRAVAFENLVRWGEWSRGSVPALQIRKNYFPFTESEKFYKWVLRWQTDPLVK